MSLIPFHHSHIERVRALHQANFGPMKLMDFVWQPCQQIESLNQECIRLVHEERRLINGYGAAYQLDSTHFRLNLLVDPNHTGERIGSSLLNEVENAVRRAGAKYLQARIFETNRSSLYFALAHNFIQIHTMRGMSLQRKDFSFVKWKGLGEQLSARGFQVITLKEEMEAHHNAADRFAKLYALAQEGWPSPDPSWTLAESPSVKVSSPELYRIMKYKDEYVGFTSVANKMSITGVHPDLRNLGVATYLKAYAINRCIEDGEDYFESASASPAMQKVNEKLGYVFNGLAEVRFVKELS
jgi:GNAT superfamily N-acetyltransferase